MKENNTKQINFKGENDISFRIEYKLGDTKKHQISSYKILVSDENGKLVATQDTNECFVVCYEDEHITTVLQQVYENGQKKFAPVNGVFAAIWCEQKKRKERICFVYSFLNSDFFRHCEMKTYGLESKVLMRFCEYIFEIFMELMYQIVNKN